MKDKEELERTVGVIVQKLKAESLKWLLVTRYVLYIGTILVFSLKCIVSLHRGTNDFSYLIRFSFNSV